MMKQILVICENDSVFCTVQEAFGSDYVVDRVASRADGLAKLEHKRSDLVFIDIALFLDGRLNTHKESLALFKTIYPTLDIVIMSSPEKVGQAVKAVKAGARSYLTYPIAQEEIHLIEEKIRESVMLKSELDYLRDKFWQPDYLDVIKTNNAEMKKVFEKIRSVAPTKTSVLLVGETGTGKSLFARLIHHHSNRAKGRFISVHCGAIPDTLLESELFGHEKGAFTSAIKRKLGKFDIARDGSIFLDEIGTITASAQIKLLQVLQDGTFHRVGGEDEIHTNARVIAATNSDLMEMCRQGLFRKDLFYRLNVFPIEILPLRDRKDDIPFLIEVLLNRLNSTHNKGIRQVQLEVIEALKEYHWPGNIREMENLLERAYILETSSVLTPQGFPAELFQASSWQPAAPVNSSLPITEARKTAIEAFEREYLKELLKVNMGKINSSAVQAGVTPRQLHKLMQKYNIRKESFKTGNRP